MNQEKAATTNHSADRTETGLKMLAAQHGFSDEAVRTLFTALVAGGATMAQFSHSELGGTGQWTKGGMIMIGDMFNQTLKARVADLCSDVARLVQDQGFDVGGPTVDGSRPHSGRDDWWGAELGTPAASGSQNNLRYAYFSASRRLAILDGGRVTIHDTGDHEIYGVSQQQSAHGSLTFTSQHGSIRLDDLPTTEIDREHTA